jgi:hypothetical protein
VDIGAVFFCVSVILLLFYLYSKVHKTRALLQTKINDRPESRRATNMSNSKRMNDIKRGGRPEPDDDFGEPINTQTSGTNDEDDPFSAS